MAMELDKAVREELVSRLQDYLDSELGVELGRFDVEFLVDFITRHMGFEFYNQGLADALKALEDKMQDFTETLYELEQQGPAQE